MGRGRGSGLSSEGGSGVDFADGKNGHGTARKNTVIELSGVSRTFPRSIRIDYKQFAMFCHMMFPGGITGGG